MFRLDSALDSSLLIEILQNTTNVILSGSALNTPKILELSGVGDPNILRR